MALVDEVANRLHDLDIGTLAQTADVVYLADARRFIADQAIVQPFHQAHRAVVTPGRAELWQDLRGGLRTLRVSPMFTIAAVAYAARERARPRHHQEVPTQPQPATQS